ncbi:glycoside hydrolase family 45 protein [Viridothelium virens]|uniref:Glycoside hydrolase family 45 protein n=1 Tax=Viridothelium virens TaxID=1048519 RepID=A0A6A6H158_VIRVR|nr:glycoside hydrolase family 45 protein [Viridothelium virens]
MLTNAVLLLATAFGFAQAATYKASFTEYGSGDQNGSPNCNTNTVACGFFSANTFQAAVSQNLFGVGPGAGAGPACGTCYKLTAQTDSSGNKLSNAGNSVTVQVNNLCPADSNPLCSQSGLSGTNQYGANVNFDLCKDDGAANALFGSSGVGLAVGTAEEVSC